MRKNGKEKNLFRTLIFLGVVVALVGCINQQSRPSPTPSIVDLPTMLPPTVTVTSERPIVTPAPVETREPRVLVRPTERPTPMDICSRIKNYPKRIVFTGTSSFEFLQSDLLKICGPAIYEKFMFVVQGGAKIEDVQQNLKEATGAIRKFKPDKGALIEGGNELFEGNSPESVVEKSANTVNLWYYASGEAPLILVSVTPTRPDKSLPILPTILLANQRQTREGLRVLAKNRGIPFVDKFWGRTFGSDGFPDPKDFRDLHHYNSDVLIDDILLQVMLN